MANDAGRVAVELAGGFTLSLGEKRLARLAAEGDERAFAILFRRHHQELYRYCLAILGRREEAEDAVQSTMVKALRALPGETREIALRPWLFRVAHNEAVSVLRSRHAAPELDPEMPDPSPGVEQEAATRARLRELVGDLEQLPARQRGALVMRELSGLSFAEIGTAFGLTPAAAKQAIYEARQSLLDMAEGRKMECVSVRESISARDRRKLRNRRIRSHLRSCSECRAFEAAIGGREEAFAILAPPLAAPAALAALHGMIGGTGASAGAGMLSGSGAALGKAAAALAAAAAIGGGAGEVSGIVEFPLGGDDRREAARDVPARTPARVAPSAVEGAAGRTDGQSSAAGGEHRSANRPLQGKGGQVRDGRGERGHGLARGVEGTQPGHTKPLQGAPPAPPGQAITPPGQAVAPTPASPAGQTLTPPGQTTSTGPPLSASGRSQSAAPSHPHAGGSFSPASTPPPQTNAGGSGH